LTIAFQNDCQEKLFEAVLANLGGLGYTGGLLQRQYSFVDWFQSSNPERIVPAAAFGQTPQSYDSACFAVLLSNGRFGEELVGDCRALGAPYAFEVRQDRVVKWRVGRDLGSSKEVLCIEPSQLDRVFKQHQQDWAGVDVLRSKGIGFKLGPRQLDFIDLGLIPALEHQISTKLDRLFREIVQDSIKLLSRDNRNNPDSLRSIYRLIFRFLAGKVLHDRGIKPFRNFDDQTKRTEILRAVENHYGEPLPAPTNTRLLDFIAASIWSKLDFRNLSVEVLAYIYENTLVDADARHRLGTHSTPHSVARYIAHQIPFEKLAVDERKIMEPFCGHGVFLVAALQRLRELLPASMDAQERHNYFVRMLQGFEIDGFALEVSRLCLMLADFPNHNGWKLKNQDTFLSKNLGASLRDCRVVLSNPPFEDFTPEEKALYPVNTSVHKPVEFLNRVLGNLPSDGMLGVVLPRQFVDGRGYRDVREKLSKRFESTDLVALPEGIFENSDAESVLLIATDPRNNSDERRFRIVFTEVAERDRDRFLSEYRFTRRAEAVRLASSVRESLNVVRFEEIWDRLKYFPVLQKSADIHRGLEWQAPFDAARYVSSTQKPGFRAGLYRAQDLYAFSLPHHVYLNTQEKHRRGGAFGLPWEKPKTFVNARRISRGPWKMAAFGDTSGLTGSQNFHALWPLFPWTPNTLAAVLNGPLANAFVDSFESARDIRIQTLQSLPMPQFGSQEISVLEGLVQAYQRIVDVKSAGFLNQIDEVRARAALLAVDAFVLKSYQLPPRMERQLLDAFQGVARPVPFGFTEYFQEGFASNIPLWMYLTPEYAKCSSQFLLAHIPQITDPVLVEALEEVAN
jgi:type I restriction-modification system DNA methylase subunit